LTIYNKIISIAVIIKTILTRIFDKINIFFLKTNYFNETKQVFNISKGKNKGNIVIKI